jgi:hypothetical protein
MSSQIFSLCFGFGSLCLPFREPSQKIDIMQICCAFGALEPAFMFSSVVQAPALIFNIFFFFVHEICKSYQWIYTETLDSDL